MCTHPSIFRSFPSWSTIDSIFVQSILHSVVWARYIFESALFWPHRVVSPASRIILSLATSTHIEILDRRAVITLILSNASFPGLPSVASANETNADDKSRESWFLNGCLQLGYSSHQKSSTLTPFGLFALLLGMLDNGRKMGEALPIATAWAAAYQWPPLLVVTLVQTYVTWLSAGDCHCFDAMSWIRVSWLWVKKNWDFAKC